MRLETVLADALGRDVGFYYLLIVQLEEPDEKYRQTLMEQQKELIKIRDKDFRNTYNDITIASLNKLWQCVNNHTNIISYLQAS